MLQNFFHLERPDQSMFWGHLILLPSVVGIDSEAMCGSYFCHFFPVSYIKNGHLGFLGSISVFLMVAMAKHIAGMHITQLVARNSEINLWRGDRYMMPFFLLCTDELFITESQASSLCAAWVVKA